VKHFLFCFLLLIFLAGRGPAQTPFPSLEPDPQALVYARIGEDGSFPWQALAEAALWASGVDPREPLGPGKPSYLEIITAGVEELRGDPALPQGTKERGDYILLYVHQKFLRAYSLNQTRLDRVLKTGQFNCVSSGVLYSILARGCDLQTGAVAVKDHAFVTVRSGDETIDVETTNPYGFDPGNKREFQDQFGKVTGFVYTPPKNYRGRTSLNPLELVSLIFINRISSLESKKRYAEAVPLAVNRMALLSGSWNAASSAFFPSGPQAAQEVISNEITGRINGIRTIPQADETLAWIDQAEEKGLLSDARGRELRTGALNNKAVLLSREKGEAAAISFLEGALARYGRDRPLEAQLQIFRNNRIARLHNTFAAAFNQRNYEEALRLAASALEEYPGNRQFLSDQALVRRTLQEQRR